MFANLKKKIEEEVGDLGRLTSPINLTGALGDRRVGGSTQGTNTPSNLGSRQSSVASLVGIDATCERPVQSRLHIPNSNYVSREPVNGEELQQLKRQNMDLKTKLDTLKKSFEEKIQHQEAEFAWKYNLKDDELAQLRSERDRMRDQLKVTENSWQEKYMRVATELENLEGLSKQENAKVKHLLLNTQNDLQGALRRIAELESAYKNKRDRDTANILLATGSDGSNVQTEEPELYAVNSGENSRDESLLQRIKELEEENEKLKELADLAEKTQEVSFKSQFRTATEEIDRKNEANDALLLQLTELQEKFEESKRLEVARKWEEENRIASIQQLEASVSNLKEMYEHQTALLQKSNKEKEDLQNHIKRFSEAIESKETEIAVLTRDQAAGTDAIDAIKREFYLLKEAHQEKIAEVKHLHLTLEDLSAKKAHFVDNNTQVNSTMESDLNTVLSELNVAKTAISELTQERNLLQFEQEKMQEEYSNVVEELNQYKLKSSQEAEVLRNDVARLQEFVDLSVNEKLSLNDRLDSAVLLETELKHLQREVQIFRDEVASAVPGANDSLSSLGNTHKALEILRQFMLEQAIIRQRLEGELHQLKEAANAEVLSLQSKTEILVSSTAQELNEMKTQLLAEAEKNQNLTNLVIHQEEALKVLTKKFEASCNNLKTKEEELEKTTLIRNSNDVIVDELQLSCATLKSNIDELETFKRRSVAEAVGLNDQLQQSIMHINVLEKELENTKEELRVHSSQNERGSAELLSLRKQIQKDNDENFSKITDLEEKVADQNQQLEKTRTKFQEKERENSALLTKLKQVSAQSVHREEDSGLLKIRTKDLENELTQLQISATAIREECSEKSKRIKELENQLGQRNCSNGALSEAENTISSLKEDLRRQEVMITEESNKVLSLRRDLDKLNEQLTESKSMVTNLQDEKDSLQTQLEEQSVLKSLAEEEAKTSSERSAELYNEVTELKKSLRTNRQQLSELKKSMTKETRNETSTSVPNNCSSVSSMEEVCLRDSSHHNESGAPYSEVNFLYLRSVLFKYLTASDPQVASSLVRVVATLLELKPEEEKLLKETQESQTRWFNSLLKK